MLYYYMLLAGIVVYVLHCPMSVNHMITLLCLTVCAYSPDTELYEMMK